MGIDDSGEREHLPPLTHWLQEAARRDAAPRQDGRQAAESSEVVLEYFESLLAHPLRSRSDVDRWLQRLAAEKARKMQESQHRQTKRELLLLGLLAISYLQYFFWDVHLEMAKSAKVYYFVPPQNLGAQAPKRRVLPPVSKANAA